MNRSIRRSIRRPRRGIAYTADPECHAGSTRRPPRRRCTRRCRRSSVDSYTVLPALGAARVDEPFQVRELTRRGYDDEQVTDVMHRNWVRFFSRHLV